MATPFVPVPVPMDSASPGIARSRSQRSSSFGSISTSSSSSKSQAEDCVTGSNKKSSTSEQPSSTPPQCKSPVIRTKLNGADSSIEYSNSPGEQTSESTSWEDRPSTPTVLGYEVMEERAKFTVYKVLVRKSPEESWVVFRRYTDFSRLNDKLKEMFPGFRLALPPKRWFKDNYNSDFLEDRQLGLQAFLQNLVAHKDIANWDVSFSQENRCRPSEQGSECSGDVESSAVEADQEMGEENSPGIHAACWCGPASGNSPPVIEVAQAAEPFEKH
ncbi:hypothetical protein EOD39_7109 [Acipenser ruthenus]|uniref:Sorting nexin-16 n=1 Tax=Acipenser ruthenus TaxID=7906 RepID=A0A444U872_ACIRT|nr:hypothetical protein EOD39_7109 [Acipenser ruthenus]